MDDLLNRMDYFTNIARDIHSIFFIIFMYGDCFQ
jgi:hypothetical protein